MNYQENKYNTWMSIELQRDTRYPMSLMSIDNCGDTVDIPPN